MKFSGLMSRWRIFLLWIAFERMRWVLLMTFSLFYFWEEVHKVFKNVNSLTTFLEVTKPQNAHLFLLPQHSAKSPPRKILFYSSWDYFVSYVHPRLMINLPHRNPLPCKACQPEQYKIHSAYCIINKFKDINQEIYFNQDVNSI